MLRLLSLRRGRHFQYLRLLLSTTTSSSSSSSSLTPSQPPPTSPSPLLTSPLPSLSTPNRRRRFPFSLTTTTLTAAATGTLAATAAYHYLSQSPNHHHASKSDKFYADLEQTLEISKCSARRVLERMRATGTAAAVLWKSLASVLSSANQEVRSGFELRVAALLADIAAASAARRAAIVAAGGGAVVDWLLESVTVGSNGSGNGGDKGGAQAEAARALAHLISDPWVAPVVLARPHAVPSLLRFIFSFQPKRGKQVLLV